MKFLFVVTDFDMGGITSSLKNLSDELILKGHEVSIVNLPMNKDFPVKFNSKVEFIEIKGLSRYWNIGIGEFKKAKGIKKPFWLIAGLFKKTLVKFGLWEKFVFANMPKIECDAAIAYRQSSICYYLIKYKTTAKSTIAFIHSEIELGWEAWLPPLKYIDHIACVSDAWSKAFAERYPQYKNKVSTVYNLFDAKSIIEKGKGQNPYTDDDGFKIVTVARLEKGQKRVDKIPEIVKSIKEKSNKKISWYLIGDGPDRELVKENIKKYGVEENVILAGAKENPYPYIKNADLFVLISSWESYGMVLVESLILGTPVLSTEYPAVHEIIDNGKNGIIAKNDIDSVVSEIIKLIEAPEIYERIKDNCLEYNYSPDIAYNQLMDLV
ncbi:MAG: glycosyltransferase [Clostridia bacterium]|nr:glycosyltransferase [Clostridia bacterium]